MWIEKLSNGKIRAVERYTDPLTEKQKKVSVTIPKDTPQQRKKASQALQLKIKEKTCHPEPSQDATLEKLFDEYMKAKKKTVKPSSYHVMESVIKILKSNFNTDILIKNISARYINDIFSNMDLSVKRKNKLIFYLKSIFRWGYQNDYINDVRFLDKISLYSERNVFPDTNGSEKKLYLEYNELSKLINALETDHEKDLTKFLALTGVRIGEAIALEYTDIDIDKRTITINKTYGSGIRETLTPKTKASYRTIYIQDELLPIVKRLRSDAMKNQLINGNRYIFTSSGNQVRYGTYYQALKRAAAVVGFDVRPHMLRHTHVALLAEQGISLEEISKRLGHENSNITRDIYYHVSEKQKEQNRKLLNQVHFF